MGYTILDGAGKPASLRLIADHQRNPATVGRYPTQAMPWYVFQVCMEVQPYHWSCEPCNRPNRRYWIQWQPTHEGIYLGWWEVITSDDSQRDIQQKLAHYARVKTAQLKRDEAEREFRRINGE